MRKSRTQGRSETDADLPWKQPLMVALLMEIANGVLYTEGNSEHSRSVPSKRLKRRKPVKK